MSPLHVIEVPLRLAFLLAGLLLPGAALLRFARVPLSPAAAFAASAVVLFASVLLFTLTGIPVAFTTLAVALTAVTFLAFGLGRRVPAPPLSSTAIEPGSSPPGSLLAPFLGLGRWTPLFLLFWAVIVYRVLVNPLAGPDTEFRWSWLAEQLLVHRSLDFYPPRIAADFASYFWVESIPPGVASLYAWAYACGGSTHALWTAPVILLQFAALHDLLWRLGHRLGGPRAAGFACLAAAACPLLSWSLLIGQETGLIALAALGLAWALASPPTLATALLAALFAALGSFTREYGPLFPLLGLAALLFQRAPRRLLLIYGALACPLSLAWLLRCTALTGNPFYSLDLAGRLPTNPLFAAFLSHLHALYGAGLTTLPGWLAVLRLLVLFAPAALLGWLVAVVHRELRLPLLLTGIAASFALWFASVPYTMGGLFYSLRVASPAFAFGAVLAGLFLARLPGRISPAVAGALLLLTLPATFTLPQNPARLSLSGWPAAAADREATDTRDREAAAIAQALGSHRVLIADVPGHQHRLAAYGITLIPPWSPQAADLFSPRADPSPRPRHLLLGRFEPTLAFFRDGRPWTKPPFATHVLWQDSAYVLLEITRP